MPSLARRVLPWIGRLSRRGAWSPRVVRGSEPRRASGNTREKTRLGPRVVQRTEPLDKVMFTKFLVQGIAAFKIQIVRLDVQALRKQTLPQP